MARPNNPNALANYIGGLREAKAAFQALPEITRDALNVAILATVQEIARVAQAKVLASPSIETRSLYNAIGWAMNAKAGRGTAGVKNVTTTMSIGGKKVRVKGIVIAGKGGSALTSAGAKLIKPRRYAHLVEFGRQGVPAEPFMTPAAEGEVAPLLRRYQDAGKHIERNLAAIGMRTL